MERAAKITLKRGMGGEKSGRLNGPLQNEVGASGVPQKNTYKNCTDYPRKFYG